MTGLCTCTCKRASGRLKHTLVDVIVTVILSLSFNVTSLKCRCRFLVRGCTGHDPFRFIFIRFSTKFFSFLLLIILVTFTPADRLIQRADHFDKSSFKGLEVFKASYMSIPAQKRTLFLGDLPIYCVEENLEQLFSQYGEIYEIRLKRDPITNRNLSYGFVKYVVPECAALALERLDGYMLHGRAMK